MYYILSLDGGGSKGMYSLGVLKEVEALIGKPIFQQFNLIYGSSTGSIIGSLLALGKTVDEAKSLYLSHVPKIMRHWTRRCRTKALIATADEIFEELHFDAFKTDIGIVTAHIDYARPMIFETTHEQAHGRQSTFTPGFGAPIKRAVIASCSAFPFFSTTQVATTNQGSPKLLDGGFVANNPTLFAIADAVNALNKSPEELRVLSVGVGAYKEPSKNVLHEFVLNQWPYWLVRKTLDCNTNTSEIVRSILFHHIQTIRVNDTFAEREYETDLLESNPIKLEKLFQLGRESFGKQESNIRSLLGV